MMAVCEDIIAARNRGVVRCGLSALATPTIPVLAREFRLRDDPALYTEIDAAAAGRLVRLILRKEMAYDSEIMPRTRAEELGGRFLQQFGPGARFFTNGNFPRGAGAGVPNSPKGRQLEPGDGRYV